VKSGTESKLKFKQLQRHFNLTLWQARGLLDTLWEFTRHNAIQGDIGRFTDDEIAVGIDWRDGAEVLIEALVKFRWLDRCPDHRLVIHDWPDHCEDSVHKLLAKRTELFADGSMPRLTRIETKARPEIKSAYEFKFGKKLVASGGRPRTPKNTHTKPSLTKPSLALPSQEGGAASPPASEDAPKKPLPPVPPDPPKDPTTPEAKKSRAEDVPLPEGLQTEEFLAARDAWFRQRRRKRLSLHAEFVGGQFARLLPLGPSQAAACLQYTVANDYDGVFPEKFTNGRKPSNGTNRVGPGQRYVPGLEPNA
jgi:hypothetical protein